MRTGTENGAAIYNPCIVRVLPDAREEDDALQASSPRKIIESMKSPKFTPFGR